MERIAKRSDIPERFGRAFAQEPDAMRLGSVFVDLPYFAGFPLQLARHYAGRITFAAPWGQIFHTRRTGSLALALIEALRRAHRLGRAEETPALAFIGGFLSHHAFDRTIHPLVRTHVEQSLTARGGHPNHWHAQCEKYQSLFWHLAHVGYNVMGTPYLKQRTNALRLSSNLWEMVQSACLQTHARAPKACEVGSWLRWARVYGRLFSSPLGKSEGVARAEPDGRRIYYDKPNFEDWCDRAAAHTMEALVAACELLSSAEIDASARARFLAVVPDVDISVGA